MKYIIRRPHAASGFSLLEVLIAVVILATGLLALAALQGSLTRSSADAKVRGRVAAMLTARMDELRSVGYGNPALNTGVVTTASTADGCDGDATDWVDCTRLHAGLASLSVTQTTRVWSSAIGATAFTENRAPAANEPEFKRITLSATWTDAANAAHTLGVSSDTSSLALTNDLIPPIDGTSSNAAAPVVRQLSPVSAGMIPIAIGGGSDTAATNPKPIIVGANSAVAETAFNVLTYNNGSSAVGGVKVQQRVETRVVACSCKNDNSPSFSNMLSKNFRPTYWDGTRYKTPQRVGDLPAAERYDPPAVKNTAISNQSDVCDQCCRDHHDPTDVDYNGPDNVDPLDDRAKFDPKRTGAHQHYSTGDLTTAITAHNGVYNEACRVIRVDGFWRVSSDANEEQFGLVRTNNDYVEKNPDPLYADFYEEFVIDYLNERFVVKTNPSATAMFNATTYRLNEAIVDTDNNSTLDAIPVKAAAMPGDQRYVHGRGLYVDNIEPEAAKLIDDSITSCQLSAPTNATTTALEKRNCALPHIPFTTVNLTQLANFDDDTAVSPDVIDVQNQVSSRGQVNGISGRANGDLEDAVVTARISNTGLSGSLPIDTGDVSQLEDRQKFVIANSIVASGAAFTVNLDPLASPLMTDGIAVNNPEVNWKIGLAGLGCRQTADASSPNPYLCRTNSALGAVAVDVLVTKYHYTDFDIPSSVTCPNASPDNSVTLTVAPSPTPRPVCKRFAVNSVTGTTGTTPGPYSVTANNGKYAEVTTINFTALPASAVITIGFGPLADLPGTVQQCNYSQNPDLTWSVSSVNWTDLCN